MLPGPEDTLTEPACSRVQNLDSWPRLSLGFCWEPEELWRSVKSEVHVQVPCALSYVHISLCTHGNSDYPRDLCPGHTGQLLTFCEVRVMMHNPIPTPAPRRLLESPGIQTDPVWGQGSTTWHPIPLTHFQTPVGTHRNFYQPHVKEDPSRVGNTSDATYRPATTSTTDLH